MTVTDYLASLCGLAEPASASRRMAEQAITAFRPRGSLPSPVSLEELALLAQARHVRQISFGSAICAEGELRPLSTGGFEVKLLRERADPRARFTLAHEIGHTYFFDYDTIPPRRLVSENKCPLSGATYYRDPEERFCDGFAQEILLPGRLVSAWFYERQRRPTIEGFFDDLEALAKHFNVSITVAITALRRTHWLGAGRLMIVLEHASSSQQGANPSLRVSYCVAVADGRWYVPPNRRAEVLGFIGASELERRWRVSHRTRLRGRSRVVVRRERLLLKDRLDSWHERVVDGSVAYRLYFDGADYYVVGIAECDA